MNLSWKLRFTRLFIVMGEVIFGIKEEANHTRLIFKKVRLVGSQNYVEGDITKMKLEFGQNIAVIAAAVGGMIQAGTAVFSVQAADADGNDVSGQFTVEVNPENELAANIVREAGVETECTGVVTLRADGDSDADEEAPIVGTLDFNYDSPNATGFELTATAVTPEPPAEPEA